MRVFYSIVFFCLAITLRAQDDLELYYPDSSTPTIVIKTKLHIIQYSKQDPRNYTEADTAALRKQIELINSFYEYLDQPTLKVEKNIPFISDAKVMFRIEGIYFYQDSVKWDRIKWGPIKDGTLPLPITERQRDNRSFFVDTRNTNRLVGKEIVFLDSTGKEVYRTGVDSTGYDRATRRGFFRTLDPVPGGLTISEVTIIGEINRNCSVDLFTDVAGEDKNFLHIFYTGSSMKEGAFGCGPSPFYLNVSNYTKGGEWANAQLAAHELGHCLGLRHTDYPQFDDLPARDKFGFIECDSIEVSNNIMGYNKCRRYLSPKQIAFIHQRYHSDQQLAASTTLCQYDENNPVFVRGRKEEWTRNYTLQGDLVIRKNKSLVIKGSVYLPEGARVILENNAQLVIEGSVEPSCGGNWQGIYYCKKYKADKTRLKVPKKRGRLIVSQNGILKGNIE